MSEDGSLLEPPPTDTPESHKPSRKPKEELMASLPTLLESAEHHPENYLFALTFARACTGLSNSPSCRKEVMSYFPKCVELIEKHFLDSKVAEVFAGCFTNLAKSAPLRTELVKVVPLLKRSLDRHPGNIYLATDCTNFAVNLSFSKELRYATVSLVKSICNVVEPNVGVFSLVDPFLSLCELVVPLNATNDQLCLETILPVLQRVLQFPPESSRKVLDLHKRCMKLFSQATRCVFHTSMFIPFVPVVKTIADRAVGIGGGLSYDCAHFFWRISIQKENKAMLVSDVSIVPQLKAYFETPTVAPEVATVCTLCVLELCRRPENRPALADLVPGICRVLSDPTRTVVACVNCAKILLDLSAHPMNSTALAPVISCLRPLMQQLDLMLIEGFARFCFGILRKLETRPEHMDSCKEGLMIWKDGIGKEFTEPRPWLLTCVSWAQVAEESRKEYRERRDAYLGRLQSLRKRARCGSE